MTAKRTRLGRTLDTLLSNTTSQQTASYREEMIQWLPVERLQPGKYQPRKFMAEENLAELAESIKAQGILQPIIISALADDEKYQIIAGERRWRAAMMAGLTTVPVVIRVMSEKIARAVSLIENIQRQDLTAFEEAVAIDQLIKGCHLTQQEAGQILGKSRTTVTNLLRLLTLVEPVKIYLQNGQIELGHAKVLLTLKKDEQITAAQEVIEKKLSVRETEQLVKKMLTSNSSKKESRSETQMSELSTQLSQKLGAKVIVRQKAKGNGQLTIYYHNPNELEALLKKIHE